MILAIDAGNSRVKWGLHGPAGWQVCGVAQHGALGSIAQAWQCHDKPTRVIISNVGGPAVGAELAALCTQEGLAVQWVAAVASQCGVRNHYVPPQQLGSDRWAALVAARQRHGGACLVVNAGTAMTVDALSPCGAFLGGLIVPGIRLMAESLLRATAEIRIGHGTVQEFPVSTGDAVESGAVLASAACIERTYGKLSERFAEGPLCLLTGGAADLLLPHIRIPLLKADHLVLEGLIAIAGV